MPEKPFYFGLYKEGFVQKNGNLKDSPDYNRFSEIIQKIDQNQRLLYLEWDGSNFFIGVQFHCSSVTLQDGHPVRDSRRMYFEQIPFGKNDPPILPQILQQFYLRAENEIKSFYSNRYDKIRMRLATSGDFNKFISGFSPTQLLSADNELSKYFAGKILSEEKCSVLSSDFIKGIGLITDIFEILKPDKSKIVFIISELDNPNDTKLMCDLLVRIPVQKINNNQTFQLITFNADTQTYSETPFTQGLYKSLYNSIVNDRSSIQKVQDSSIRINNFIHSYLSSKESAKMPIGELCTSRLGKLIAKELIIKKIKNKEKIDADILKLVYTSQQGSDRIDLGKMLLNEDYIFPELYTDAIKKTMSEGDPVLLSYFVSKNFPEYRNFYSNLEKNFTLLPWGNPKFRSNAKIILGKIFAKSTPEIVGEGGKIFTRLLYQNLHSYGEIDQEFIHRYSEKMKFFDIKIPPVENKSLLHNPKLRGLILGYGAFAVGFIFALVFAWFYHQVLPGLHQQLDSIINPSIQFWIMISAIIIVVLLVGFYIYKRKFR
jgi:hypothetical protein